jgi:hypothetical protein
LIIQEVIQKCSPYENICFGRISVDTLQYNVYGLTDIINVVINIEKDCGILEQFQNKYKDYQQSV